MLYIIVWYMDGWVGSPGRAPRQQPARARFSFSQGGPLRGEDRWRRWAPPWQLFCELPSRPCPSPFPQGWGGGCRPCLLEGLRQNAYEIYIYYGGLRARLSQRVHWGGQGWGLGVGLSERVRQKGPREPAPEPVTKAVAKACPLIFVRIAADVP